MAADLPAEISPVPRSGRSAFTLVEVMLAMSLLTLVVFALMAVFNSTQQAFRASVTQTDVLEGGRSAMELITSDLREMTASGGSSNWTTAPRNFIVLDNQWNSSLLYQPLQQQMVASSALRTNVLQHFFLISRENNKWTGVGYVVVATNQTPLYPLYRYTTETNLAVNPLVLYADFTNQILYSQWTNMSHVMDGVVHFVVRAYDTNGVWLTNGYAYQQPPMTQNIWYTSPQVGGEVGFCFFGKSLPAAVELQIGVLEDRTLLRAESRTDVSPTFARSNYLAQQSGSLHLFRQRVNIPNFDPTAFQ
jgi:type II secretory pathway component PulJ